MGRPAKNPEDRKNRKHSVLLTEAENTQLMELKHELDRPINYVLRMAVTGFLGKMAAKKLTGGAV